MRDAMARTLPPSEFESNTWVRAARRELALGQVEFAKQCGVSQPCVSKWENDGLALTRGEANELHHTLNLPEALSPAIPEPCENENEAAHRYAAHSSSLIIQSSHDADWRAAQLCASIAELASRSDEAGCILAGAYANRSLWHLVHQDLNEASRHAQIAIRLGRRFGFNVESGYAFWSLARTRFLPGFGSVEDIAILDRELHLAEAKARGLPAAYISLLRGARAMAAGDSSACAAELARARDEAPGETDLGVVGRWGETYWQRDITMYHGMMALCSGRFAECCRVIEPLACEQFARTAARQYGQVVARSYFQAAKARLGSREPVDTAAPLISPQMLNTIMRHTIRLSGYRAT